MFTGIVEEIGTVERRLRRGKGARLRIRCQEVLKDLSPGDSVCVSGACLTAVRVDGRGFESDLSPETVSRTTLGSVRPGSRVNLERALRVGGRIGGHYVNGHVDCMGTVRRAEQGADGAALKVALDRQAMQHVVEKGCVAVDGVSLTPFGVTEELFCVALIPETVARTTLGERRAGDKVNIELDILLKHSERIKALEGSEKGTGLTWEKLGEYGID